MASVTICSDFGAQENIVTVSIVSPSICHEVMGPDAMILVFYLSFLNVEFSYYWLLNNAAVHVMCLHEFAVVNGG